MDIGAVLAHARRAAGLTQMELAAATGVSRITVARDEGGTTTVTVDRLARYADALGVDFRIATSRSTAPATGLEPVTYRFQPGDAA